MTDDDLETGTTSSEDGAQLLDREGLIIVDKILLLIGYSLLLLQMMTWDSRQNKLEDTGQTIKITAGGLL